MDYSEEDIGNIVALEHVNVQVPDQSLATLFYIVAMGFTRDPYINVGLNNMWANVGEQQFHLPTREPQIIPGHIGIVVPDLDVLKARLESVAPALSETRFSWSVEGDHVSVTCPWGNRFQCYSPGEKFGDMALGIPYVEFTVPTGRAAGIARFYDQVLGAPSILESGNEGAVGRVRIGRSQWLLFRETLRPVPPYDGHHIAVYVANFSRPYGFMRKHGLLAEDVRNHQFRFQDIVDPEGGEPVFRLEHEVRSLRHPMFNRFFVNRDPLQSQRQYRRGRDALTPFVE
jgi:catechol 2,3-dioxygenase-like lactoylglutathione lyase family enzyme